MTGDMTPENGDRPTVLAVDDEVRVGQAFDLWLNDEYEVLTATSGSDALDQMSEDVDIVLLDRHMPGMSGDEVLERIRSEGYGCTVAMVTAVDPDFDIVDMPFDHYVSKPVGQEELRAIVDRLLDIGAYDEHVSELYGISQKLATLEAEKSPGELADDDRYAELVDRDKELRAATDDLLASMEANGVTTPFEQVDDHG